jgi:hypothetical protein
MNRTAKCSLRFFQRSMVSKITMRGEGEGDQCRDAGEHGLKADHPIGSPKNTHDECEA